VARDRLRRYLRHRGFGYLQHSVWISPDPLTQERHTLAGGVVDVGALVLLEARPASGETDDEIVASAWDFALINDRYEKYLAVLDDSAQNALKGTAAPEALKRWCQRERVAWLDAVSMDPLLPEALLPAAYLGKRAWKARIKALQPVAARIRQFEMGPATEK
jgi:DNA-binding transcriptional regulator PaaX